jgi:DUF4097 and DUF4098 domain-containing protein YvlB
MLLLTGLSMAVVGPVAPASAQPTVEESDDGYVSTTTRTFSVAPGGTLDLSSRGGPIEVSSWDRDEVEVEETVHMRRYDREEAERYVQNYTTSYEKNGSTVEVDGPNDRSRVWRDFTVRLPKQFTALLRTSGGSISVRDLEGRVDAETSGGSIDVSGITGAVDVQTSGGSLRLVDVDGRAGGRTAGGSIEARRVTGAVVLETAGGSIRVEEAGGEVEAETAGGSIDVDGAEGPVRAETAGGDVKVANARQRVDAETSGGDVELESIGGPATARTSGGDIEGRGFDGRVDARTSAGDVELEDVRAGVTARASVGDVEVEVTASNIEGDYSTTLSSSHGDIRLVLPAGLPATIDAEVESLYGSVDREDIYSDFALTRELSEDSEVLRATGPLNGGGPEFDLRSKGGSIEIIKR